MTDRDRFMSLSLRDLLDAREAYHVHLLRQRNVVATAVGRYLARPFDEAAPQTPGETLKLPPGKRPPRTLDKVRIEPWSWPCVIVFVDRWMDADEIQSAPDEMVPRQLYLPDGRSVPTCVVLAPPNPGADDPAEHLSFPSRLLGGGYVCLSEVQGRERAGSIGCLVTDGLKTYALTNRHVAGEPGTALHTLVGGAPVPLGVSAARSVGRLPFAAAYEGLPGARTELAVDAGLIEVADVNDWTTQVFGVGVLDPMLDLGPETLALDLLGTPVRAFGAASGVLKGQVLALFHRFQTRSGVEYVADAVIAPRLDSGPLQTRPGDSGTLWVCDPPEAPGADAEVPHVQPLAVQWGGARLWQDVNPGPYALVTFLSTACRALDVEPVLDVNVGYELYWGEVGHYTIGARACDLVAPAALRDFFVANRERISFDLRAIVDGDFHTPEGTLFYPLADVPDRVWKQRARGVGRPHEGPNHFADMDDPLDEARPEQSLLGLFAHDPSSVAPGLWQAFYERKGVTPRNMGLLPFRVAQLYRAIVDALRADDVDSALAAAGVMAHYVGDACQPLHVSRFHDGRTSAEQGVHEAYETRMLGAHVADVVAGLDIALAGAPPAPAVSGHEAAARAVVALMQRVFRRLAPERICDAYDQSHRSDDLWAALGADTIACIADGCETLAGLWSSAWAEAGADAPPAVARDQDALRRRYMDPEFAPSRYLPELARALPWTAPEPEPEPVA